MSFPEDDSTMPDYEAEYRPGFEEVLARIKNGTLAELANGSNGGMQMIIINNRPHVDGEVWADPDGGLVHSFKNKFQDGFEGWQPGEVVNARFVLTHRPGDGKPGLLVSDAYVGDIRNADTFVLPELSEEDDATLSNLGMALIDADVEVTGAGTYRVSNMFDYEARINRINAIQALWDGETVPRIGEQVLMQGEVASYTAGEADYKNASFPVVQVRLAGGQTVAIEMTNGYINYENGNLDFLYPEGLQAGDIVQINTTFGNASTWLDHKDRQPTFHASFCRSAYLLQPSAERLATYEAHRADIAARLANLSALDGQAFRDAYSDMMRTYVELSGEQRKRPRMLLTDQEKRSLKEVVDQKFPNDADGNPSPDKPLTDFGHIVQMADVNKGYGVDVYGMSRHQFYAFCLDVALGRTEADHSLETSVDYPYWILSLGDEKFSPQEQFEVYRHAAEHWLPYIAGKEVIYRGDTLTDPARQITFDEEYLAERSIEFMASVARELPEAREYLYGLAMHSLRKFAVAEPERSRRAAGGMLQYTFCSRLGDVVASSAVWDVNQGWIGVKDPAKLSYFVDKLPELEMVARELESRESHRAHDVLELMAKIVKLNALPPYTV